jgi:hypothetical protein
LKPLQRIAIAAIGLGLMLWIGYYNQAWKDAWVIIWQSDGNALSKTFLMGSASKLFLHPKLWATSIMSVMYMAIGVGTIFLFTQSRLWTLITSGLYMGLMITSLLIYWFGTISEHSFAWQCLAQDIKMLIQSPFILGIMIAANQAWQYLNPLRQ